LQTQAVGDDGIETISNRYRIGKAYLSQKFYPKAMESYKKMISICEINKDGGCEYVAFLNDLGHCYREMKDY
jgi:tetratricopeptide (TPR) repeat protein